MRIVQALPGRMRFEARSASSVELCVSEWVAGSRHRATTTIVAEQSDKAPLLEVDILRLAPARRFISPKLALQVRRLRADVIVTQQHIPTAAVMAHINMGTPVVLQTHNFIEPPATGPGAWRRNWLRERQFATLAGITLISDAVRQKFEADWPGVSIPRTVVTNGFDFSSWHPAVAREKLILIVGRAQREKGILEATQGTCRFLERHKDWRAALILSSIAGDPPYYNEIENVASALGGRCAILSQVPYTTVREMTERASIAVVASQWDEPFGRTALEAHAGRVALISSGTGGLRQISGDGALYLDRIDPTAIATAIEHLAADDALREAFAERGARRVRSHFSLVPTPEVEAAGEMTVCERLDTFLEQVVGRRPEPAGFRSSMSPAAVEVGDT